MPFAGIFCRWESSTQTPGIAVLQCAPARSGERRRRTGFAQQCRLTPGDLMVGAGLNLLHRYSRIP